MRAAGEVLNRATSDTFGRFHIDQKLGQAHMTRVRFAIGTKQRNNVIGAMRIGGPYFLAVNQPAVGGAGGSGFKRGQIGPRIGFAHSNRKACFARGNLRDNGLLLLFSAITVKQLAALSIGDPVMRRRRAPSEQLFHNNIPFQRGSAMPPVLLG